MLQKLVAMLRVGHRTNRHKQQEFTPGMGFCRPLDAWPSAVCKCAPDVS